MRCRIPLSVAATAAVFALLASPALAAGTKKCTIDTSAVNVYVEQVPTACGSKPTSGPTSSTGPTVVQPVTLSPTVKKKIQRQGGKDRDLLEKVATKPTYGAEGRLLGTAGPTLVSSSVFDLGSGPTALFAGLLAAALLLAFGDGMRRRRRRSS